MTSVNNKTHVDVILRTCDRRSVHMGTRFVGASKSEIILRCTRSLIESMNECDADLSLQVIDDHSSPQTLEELQNILARSRHPASLEALEETGANASAIRANTLALGSRDLVYFVEDDYLHYPEALSEMCDAYVLFKERLGGTEVALVPCDDPLNYRRMETCRVVAGPRRAWRTNVHSTSTMFLSAQTVKKFRHIFERFNSNAMERDLVTEEETINTIWREGGVTLFSPMPSLAFHLQDTPPLFEDWQALWEEMRAEEGGNRGSKEKLQKSDFPKLGEV